MSARNVRELLAGRGRRDHDAAPAAPGLYLWELAVPLVELLVPQDLGREALGEQTIGFRLAPGELEGRVALALRGLDGLFGLLAGLVGDLDLFERVLLAASVTKYAAHEF